MNAVVWGVNLVFAVNFSHSVLENTEDHILNSSQYWDEMWEQSFLSDQFVPYQAIVYAATILAILGLGMFWVQLAQVSFKHNDYGDTLTRLFMAGLLILLLWDGAFVPSRIVFGIRQMVNGLNTLVMETQVADSNVRSVLEDHLVSSTTRDILSAEYRACMDMSEPEVHHEQMDSGVPGDSVESAALFVKHECLLQVSALADEKLAEAEAAGWCGGQCVGLQRFVNELNQQSEEYQQYFEELTPEEQLTPYYFHNSADSALGNVLAEEITSRVVKHLMGLTQQGLLYLLELAFWLSALMSPIAVALSLFPNRTVKPLWAWMMTISSTGLALLYYVVLVSAMAVFMQSDLGTGNNDVVFALVFGLFAPVLAFGLSTATSLTAVAGMARTGAAVATAGIQAATLGIVRLR